MHASLTKLDILCLLPMLIVASAPVIMMLTITVSRNLKVIYGFSLIMFAAALAFRLFYRAGYSSPDRTLACD